MSVSRNWDALYVATVVPYKRGSFEVDYGAYRAQLRYFLQPKFVGAGGGIIVNPEAGEVFYLTSDEKKKLIEIAVEEVAGRVPLFSGIFAMTTEEAVRDAVTAKDLGVDGLFFIPPSGSGDITYAWNPVKYPEVWVDWMKALYEATGLPMIVHPTSGSNPFYGVGLPVEATVSICNEVRSIVGWKMTYSVEGYKLISQALRNLDHHVGVFAAPANIYHENLLYEQFDGTVCGGFCYSMEHMIDHIEAWKNNDLSEARRIWNAGLSQVQDYVYSDYSRLHVRYKVGAWLRELVPTPYMRAPQPLPKVEEISEMQRLLTVLGVEVISDEKVQQVIAEVKTGLRYRNQKIVR